MKTEIWQFLRLRLYLGAALAARYGVAFLVSRHLHLPIEDALIGILLYTATWTDTQVYFAFKQPQHPLKPAHPMERPDDDSKQETLALPLLSVLRGKSVKASR